MTSYKKLKRDILGKTCRQCLNERYRLRLKPRDCAYHMYGHPCACCGRMSNIVMGIRARSRWKLIFGRRHRAWKTKG